MAVCPSARERPPGTPCLGPSARPGAAASVTAVAAIGQGTELGPHAMRPSTRPLRCGADLSAASLPDYTLVASTAPLPKARSLKARSNVATTAALLPELPEQALLRSRCSC